ncbi:YcgN family cysteine cluster protein [Novosphingobium aquimarinum]|uniref:YcgN family cysteine cluster protein n=1 Tax=Novosphingobium aquimarinum TaxID=2682494 RepID=UPI0012EB67C7|nr:YcgN family cysteine cluster protein [Novosphingobium aquimarinum]
MGKVGGPRPFWERPLESLNREEWEALCDGCGQCCTHKLEDADTGDIFHTNVACKLLDLKTARCADYRNRLDHVPDCLRLTLRNVPGISWLPETCAYRLRADDKPLHDWHYLISGDRDAVRAAGVAVIGKVISEVDAGPIEQHAILPEGYEAMLDEDDDDRDGDAYPNGDD